MAQSVSDITSNGAIVHGYVATDQPRDSHEAEDPFFVTAVAPAPRIPRPNDFNPSTDWDSLKCGTLGSDSSEDPRARPLDAPLGDVARATFNLSGGCQDPRNRNGIFGGLASDTTYNVRICVYEAGLQAAYNCGGVISFTTDPAPLPTAR